MASFTTGSGSRVNIESLNIYFPGNLEFKVDRKSEWIKAEHAVDNLGKAIRMGYQDAVEKIAKKLVRTIQRAIDMGRPPGGGSWVPLSQGTLRTYHKHFPDATTPWKRSGKMRDCIDFYAAENSDRVYVGVSQYSPYTEDYERGEDTRKGLTTVQLAKLLEFGGNGGKIPSRPLFNPALDAIGGKSAIRKAILEELRSKAQRLGFKYIRIR